MSIPDIDAAEQFIASHGRVLDRRRFERLFREGEARPVRDAVAAYRNPDGGFGHGLEPDARSPGSQPAAVEVALRTLHEADAWSPDLDHLAQAQREDGGWMFNWLAWSPAAESDWRGSITVDALCTLRAYGRL